MSETSTAPAPIQLTVEVSSERKSEKTWNIKADAATRSATALQLGINDVTSLELCCTLAPIGQQQYRLIGTLEASVFQTCVVTTEPVAEHIKTSFDVVFWPEDQVESWLKNTDASILVDDPDPESYADQTIDIGRFVYELLATALDPYPRKAAAVFVDIVPNNQEREEERKAESPFAVLKNLKS